MERPDLKAVKQRITLLVFFVALIMAVIPPMQYFHVARTNLSHMLESEVVKAATKISERVYAAPEIWRFQAHMLEWFMVSSEEQVEKTDVLKEIWRITDSDGNVIVETGTPPLIPVIKRSFILNNGPEEVGRVEHVMSLRPIINHTVFIAVISTFCALLIFISVRNFTLRALDEAYLRLESTLTELQKTKEYLDAIMDNMMQGVITIDKNGLIKTFNAWAEFIFCYQAAEVMGKNVNILMPESDEGPHDDYIKNYLETGKAKIIGIGRETEARRKNGELFPVSLNVTEIQIDNEPVFVGLVADITERKEAETQLGDISKRLELILDSAGEGIYGLDLNGYTTFANKAAQDMLGYSRDEMLNAPQHDLIHHHYPDGTPYKKEDCNIYAALKDGKTHTEDEEVLWKKDGTALPVEYTSTPIRNEDGQITGAVVVFRDITERKREQAKVQELAKFPEKNPNPILQFNEDGKLIYANPAARGILKSTSYEDIFSRSLSKQISKNDRIDSSVIRSEIILNNTPYVRTIKPWVRNGIRTINVYMFDITEQKKYQKDLQKAKEDADQANLSKSEFLANMSHELRTPLNSIMGMTRMLVEDPDMDKDNRDMANTVYKSAINLLETVNDILDISKIESGNMVLEKVGFDLKDMVAGVMETMAPMASEKSISLKYYYENDNIPCLVGDPFRMSRVLTNLIGNAIKYTNRGHITIMIDGRPLEKSRVEIYCTVKDTGIGIPEDRLKVIFEKFTQADLSTTRKYGGTGLGLAITKNFVEMMGGTVGVESEVGKGSVFWFKIPFMITDKLDEKTQGKTRRERWKSKSDKARSRLPVEKARILVAEDHRMNQMFIRRLLERMGFGHIDIEENGVLALEAYGKEKYDLVLMDCHMPEKNGYEATEEIRKQEKDTWRHIPVVALTADAMKGTEEKCLKAGMDEYITKPIDADEVKDILAQWIIFPEEEDETEVLADITLLEEYADTPEDIKRFVEIFIGQSEESIKVMVEHCFDGKSKDWVEAAHKLKGGSGMVGAVRLSELCIQAQKMKEATTEEREGILENIRKEYEATKNYLQKSI